MTSSFVESHPSQSAGRMGHPAGQVYVARAPSPATAIIVKGVLRDKGKGRARLQSCRKTPPPPNILSFRTGRQARCGTSCPGVTSAGRSEAHGPKQHSRRGVLICAASITGVRFSPSPKFSAWLSATRREMDGGLSTCPRPLKTSPFLRRDPSGQESDSSNRFREVDADPNRDARHGVRSLRGRLRRGTAVGTIYWRGQCIYGIRQRE